MVMTSQHFNWEEAVKEIYSTCHNTDYEDFAAALSQAFKQAVDAAEPEKKPAKQYGYLSREGWQKYDTETGFNTATAEYKSNLNNLIDGRKTDELPHINRGEGFTHSGAGNTCGCREADAKEDLL